MKIRKWMAVLLASALCVSLFAGCGETKEEVKVTPQEETAAASSADTKEAAAPEAKSEAPAAAEEKSEAPAAETPAETKAAEPEATAESLLNAYYETAKDLQSISFDMDMNMEMGMDIMGMSQEVKVNMNVKGDAYGDNAYMTGKMEMVNGEETETQEVEQYVIAEDGKYYSYSYDKETDSWSKTDTQASVISKEMIPELDPALFTLAEEGGEYKLTGTVNLQELLDNMSDQMAGMMEGVGAMGIDTATGTAEIEYYFSKDTNELTRVKIDMAEAIEQMFKDSFSSMMESYSSEETGELNLEINVENFFFELSNIELNKGKEIVLPEEAKSAVESESAEGLLPGMTDETSETSATSETSTASSSEEEELSVELAETFEFKDEYKEFTLNGNEYKAGETVLGDLLKDNSLELEEEYQDRVVNADDTDYCTAYLDDSFDYLSFTVYNPDNEPKDMAECVIYSVSISSEEAADFTVAGLKLGCTMEEAMAALGNPTYGYESEYYSSYSWESEEWSAINLSLSPIDGEGSTGLGINTYPD